MPEWARRERQNDLLWIQDNLHVFWPVATTGFAEGGRGAIVVDTTSRPTGEGNPYGYLLQAAFEHGDDEDIKRMIGEYDPRRELVLVLIKSENRTSTYRVAMKRR